MTDPVVVRGAALALPVLLLVALVAHRRPTERDLAAAVLATAWSAAALAPLNLVATRLGWWTFDAEGAVWRGLPVDLWWSWALLWGVVPALALRVAHPVPVVAALVWVDLLLMPAADPVVRLGDRWLVGEAVGIGAALLPAVLLARWTLGRRHLALRAWAQAACAGALLVALPVLAAGTTPRWPAPVTAVGIQVALLVCLPGLAAMRELARTGGGTPLPYDPPRRLVDTGPYAYVRNPMQLTVALLFAVLAATFGDARLVIGTVVAVGYSAGLAAWHEGAQLRRRFGDGWEEYVTAVPSWRPRWRPVPPREPAVLWVAADCGTCRGVARWLLARRPVGLDLRPAAGHPDVLWRLTYEHAGTRAQGVRAFARALGHLHLGWAVTGWTLDLPVMSHFAQLGTDAFGAGPRPSRTTATCPPLSPPAPPGRPAAGW
ncbi:protein-S-isoprenylcysteine O-methyltransferase Ste14 [Isoptericola jiangsuensis]|uniref:Protein-S-isoprenylcysteine O-methyltransferase Ste14 n=1 Tax=Isoptericola jiangsuensis TaxID=548579 RepID=A0A2A9EYP9_9MICO|nr:methyltransferase [Isoptericola jiangsuensis]PFG43883.1 protein-S-isoprenylcysteine O-methyltransferase Ste14 [Isoptericola jiangsuensis]